MPDSTRHENPNPPSQVGRVGPRYGDVLISVPTRSARRFREWHVKERYDEFTEREAACLKQIQSEDCDAFTHITWSHYHDFVYFRHHDEQDKAAYLEYLEQTLIEWMSLFDFDEPAAMFFVFSDHGDYVHRLTPPKDYLRWCFVRDNTENPVVPRKFVAGDRHIQIGPRQNRISIRLRGLRLPVSGLPSRSRPDLPPGRYPLLGRESVGGQAGSREAHHP